MTLKRESELESRRSDRAAEPTRLPRRPVQPTAGGAGAADGAFSGALDAYKYVGFEDQFRGSQAVIRARLDVVSAALRRRVRRARRGLRPRRVPRSARRPRHQRARHRPESRDGGGVSRAWPRCHRSGRGRLPVDAPRRLARRHLRRAGGRAPAAGLPAAVSRARVPQAPPGRAPRARDAESRLLGRVLRQLHPRHHARLAAAPGDAEVPRRRERLHEGGDRVPLAGAAAGSPPADRRPRRRRCRRSAT